MHRAFAIIAVAASFLIVGAPAGAAGPETPQACSQNAQPVATISIGAGAGDFTYATTDPAVRLTMHAGTPRVLFIDEADGTPIATVVQGPDKVLIHAARIASTAPRTYAVYRSPGPSCERSAGAGGVPNVTVTMRGGRAS
jgi:hypothetical protein